jgi:hypothetical protein
MILISKEDAKSVIKALDDFDGWADHGCPPSTAVAVKIMRGAMTEQPAPVQDLPFGVGGGLVAIKTLLSRDPCGHANTAIEMIDAILKEHPAAQPAPVQEPIGYLFQHEETGLTTVVDVQQVEWGFEKNNPRHQKIGPVYTTPPAAQPAPTVQEPDAHNRTLRHRIRVHIANREHYSKVEFLDKLHEILHESEQTAQPAVPDAITDDSESLEYRTGWNDCRAEMLRGMKP